MKKTLVLVSLFSLVLTGCHTAFTLPAPSGVNQPRYSNWGFNKSFSEAEASFNTNGTWSVKLKGYKSDNQQLHDILSEVVKRVPTSM